MRKKIGLFGLFFLSFSLFTGMAQASGELPFQAAPLSPAFLAYQESLKQKDAPPSRSANAAEKPSGYIPSPVDLSHLQNADYSAYFAGRRRAALPMRYDLRDYGAVTPVKSQLIDGPCWAFAALGSMESAYLKQTGAALDLSEMHLSYYAFRDPIGFTYRTPNVLGNGGVNNIAVAAMARWTGPVLEADVPYTGDPYNAIPSGPSSNYPNRFHLRDAIFLNLAPLTQNLDRFNPTDDMRKELIMLYGGISIGFHAASGNIAYNEATYAWCNLGVPNINPDHGVLIVGWDDTFPRENFNAFSRPSNNGAWLVKNSWGAEWGDGGYFWLSYEDSSLVDGTVFIPGETADYDNIYDYDELGWCRVFGQEPGNVDTAWMANVFRARGREELKAVSFYTTDFSAMYEISVYTNLRNAGDPRSGTRVSFQTGSQPLAGYHTERLNTPALLSAGTSFAVVIKMTTPYFYRPLAAEGVVPGYSDSAVAHPGESFFSRDGTAWIDAAGYQANACIKAFTANSSAPEPSAPTQPAPTPGGNTGSGGGGGCNAAPGALIAVALLAILLRCKDWSR